MGKDRRVDELPAELAWCKTRLQKMRAVKEAFEAEARDRAARKAAEKARQKGDEQAAATAADKATQSRGPSAASPTPSSA